MRSCRTKCHAVCCDKPALQIAQSNPTGGTTAWWVAKPRFGSASQHRRWEVSSYLKGGLPVWPTLLLPFLRFGTRLLPKPARFHSGSFEELAHQCGRCYGDSGPDPRSSHRYNPLQSLQASHTFQAGCEVRTILCQPASSHRQYRKPPARKLHYCDSNA